MCSPCPRLYYCIGCRDKHHCLQPFTPQPGTLPLDHCNLHRHVGVNNLPKVVARQCGGRDSNSSSCKSIALTTRPPGQPMSGTSAYHRLTRSAKTCVMTPVCNLRRCKISCRAEGRRWCEDKSRQHRQASCSVAARTSPTHQQGWARDVNGRDRDVSLPRQRRLASPAETRPRRDVQISRRDRDETFAGLET